LQLAPGWRDTFQTAAHSERPQRTPPRRGTSRVRSPEKGSRTARGMRTAVALWSAATFYLCQLPVVPGIRDVPPPREARPRAAAKHRRDAGRALQGTAGATATPGAAGGLGGSSGGSKPRSGGARAREGSVRGAHGTRRPASEKAAASLMQIWPGIQAQIMNIIRPMRAPAMEMEDYDMESDTYDSSTENEAYEPQQSSKADQSGMFVTSGASGPEGEDSSDASLTSSTTVDDEEMASEPHQFEVSPEEAERFVQFVGGVKRMHTLLGEMSPIQLLRDDSPGGSMFRGAIAQSVQAQAKEAVRHEQEPMEVVSTSHVYAGGVVIEDPHAWDWEPQPEPAEEWTEVATKQGMRQRELLQQIVHEAERDLLSPSASAWQHMAEATANRPESQEDDEEDNEDKEDDEEGERRSKSKRRRKKRKRAKRKGQSNDEKKAEVALHAQMRHVFARCVWTFGRSSSQVQETFAKWSAEMMKSRLLRAEFAKWIETDMAYKFMLEEVGFSTQAVQVVREFVTAATLMTEDTDESLDSPGSAPSPDATHETGSAATLRRAAGGGLAAPSRASLVRSEAPESDGTQLTDMVARLGAVQDVAHDFSFTYPFGEGRKKELAKMQALIFLKVGKFVLRCPTMSEPDQVMRFRQMTSGNRTVLEARFLGSDEKYPVLQPWIVFRGRDDVMLFGSRGREISDFARDLVYPLRNLTDDETALPDGRVVTVRMFQQEPILWVYSIRRGFMLGELCVGGATHAHLDKYIDALETQEAMLR